MTETKRRPGVQHRGGVDDQHRAGEVSSESSRIACLPVRSLPAALDHRDPLALPATGRWPLRCRCRRWSR